MTVKITVFVILALLIFLKFRSELKSFAKHDFYMFFAFESLLVLMFFNIHAFVEGIFSWYHVISWVLLLISASLALSGFYSLKTRGRAVEGWEETTHLITGGIFRYTRHPLYASLILLGTGIFIKNITLQSAIPVFVAISFLVAASIVEEKENLRKFGSAYDEYRKTSKAYIPFIF